jgi:hypothetical protein
VNPKLLIREASSAHACRARRWQRLGKVGGNALYATSLCRELSARPETR